MSSELPLGQGGWEDGVKRSGLVFRLSEHMLRATVTIVYLEA